MLCEGCSWFLDKDWAMFHSCKETENCECASELYCVREKKDYHFWTNQWEQWKLRDAMRFMANITPDQLPEDIWCPWELAHHNIYINSIKREIVGVEAFASARSPSSPYRHAFVIAVKR